jgi:hypothetical protein
MLRAPVVVALLLIPTIVEAQRTNRGKVPSDWDRADTAMGRPVPAIKQNEIEKLSAVHIMVGKKKDLKLNDEQLAKLKELGKAEESQNVALYQRIDSLRLAMRRRAGEDGDQERARSTVARQDMLAVLRQIRQNYDSTFKMCTPILSEEQMKLASTIVEEERQEADDDLRSKIGGGRSRPSAGGPSNARRRP